jgi:excisionase family DNA binding protein
MRPDPVLRKGSYSVAEVATMMGVSERSIYRLIQRGEVEGAKVGMAVRISRFTLVAFSAAANLEIDDRVLNGGTR